MLDSPVTITSNGLLLQIPDFMYSSRSTVFKLRRSALDFCNSCLILCLHRRFILTLRLDMLYCGLASPIFPTCISSGLMLVLRVNVNASLYWVGCWNPVFDKVRSNVLTITSSDIASILINLKFLIVLTLYLKLISSEKIHDIISLNTVNLLIFFEYGFFILIYLK